MNTIKRQTLLALGCALLAASAQADIITFNFLENGTGDLGSSTQTFMESGISLTATSSGPHLFVKTGGGDENGLGLAGTPDNEINGRDYISLQVPTIPPSMLNMILIGSVQAGESGSVYFGSAPGMLTTLLGTLTGIDGGVPISGLGSGWVTVVAPTGNVLIDSVTATIPDGGTTVALLGSGLAALGFFRRKLIV